PSDLAELCDALLKRDPGLRPDARALAKALGSRPADATWSSDEPQAAGPGDPLVGRESELAQLRAAFEATCSGRAVAALVSGESGVGKTALCRAFVDELRQQGNTTLLTGRCYERERVPFKGIDSLIDDISRHLRRLRSVEAAALMPRDVFALARIF